MGKNKFFTFRAEPLLSQPDHYSFALNPQRWPRLGLHACRYPCLAFVFEGETDISLGITPDSLAPQAHKTDIQNRVATLSLNSQSCLLIPEGVPYSDASRPHGYREHIEKAYSRVLWLRALPMGAMVQISRTQGGTQYETPAVLSKSPQLLSLTQLLLMEAQRASHSSEVIVSYLQTILLLLDESVIRNYVITSNQFLEGRELSDIDVSISYRMKIALRSLSGPVITSIPT